MKFVCQNCKAKYQIDDEKVAGRQLKMKCRKCGHVIPISGMAVASGTGPERKPTPPPRRATPPAGEVRRPRSSQAAGPAPRPGSMAPRAGSAQRPSVSGRVTPVPRGTPKVAAPQVTVGLRGRSAAAAALIEDPAPSAGSSPSASRLPVSRPVLEDRWSSLPPGSEQPDAGPRPSAVPGALAGAFQSAVGGRPGVSAPSSRTSQVPPSGPQSMVPVFSDPPPVVEQWFVGIDGVPAGPLGLEEIRAKAAAGLVGLDSLVWREGFEDWLPVRKFPELLTLVQDAGARPASADVAPAAPSSPVAPSDPAVVSGRIEQADPFAPSLASAGVATSSAATSSAASPGPVASGGTAPSASPEIDPDVVLGRRRSAFSPAALLAVVVAVGFGVTVGFVVFGGEKTKVIREVVEVPVAQGPAPAENVPAPEAEAKPASSAPPEDSSPPAGKTSAGSRVASTAAAKTSSSSQEGLSGLSGLKGLAAGPQIGPGSEGSSSKSQPLSAGQIQSTVSRFTPSVRRSCWQPALDARDPSAPATARVTVSITVGSDGKVQGASAGDDPRGYPGLASCISRRVRGWTFPPSSGTTTVQVPFVFAAQ